jgi:glycerophosphoryl diester phosphodiesterase
VRLYAHRGSPGPPSPENPLVENTVAAVTRSLRAGADGVEVDLRLSRDGVLVVCHDHNLRRLTGSALEVASTSWDDLRTGSERHGVALARAEWVLAAVAGRPVVLELKQPPPGLTPPTALALVELLTTLGATGLPLEVTVSSFSPALLAAVRACSPAATSLRTALLGRPSDRPAGVLRRALDAGHDEIHPHVAALLADPAAVDRAHALGVRVVPWTVNRGRPLRRLAWLGVDAVITDVPASARLALASRRSAAAPTVAAARRTATSQLKR